MSWRPGDPVGRRRFASIGDLRLESGEVLPDVTIAYESFGEPAPARDNAVLILHALTGDSHVAGPAGPGHPTPGWWDGLVGAGRPVDTNRWQVLVPNLLGGCQGSTGPSSPDPAGVPWGSRFPRLTTRDQVAAEFAWADAIGIDRWALVLGGSAGGMRALEWAVTRPAAVRRLFVLASTAATGADQLAWATPQSNAIRADPDFHGGDYYGVGDGLGPRAGLTVARQIAHATYRSAIELEQRFGRNPQPGEDPARGGRYAVQGYLDHHGRKLVERFDPNSYLILTEAMNSHDLGRGRGGVEAALARITARTAIAGIDSDRLYPVSQSERLAAGIPGVAGISVINSVAGHDGFLTETEAVGKLAEQLLGQALRPATQAMSG